MADTDFNALVTRAMAAPGRIPQHLDRAIQRVSEQVHSKEFEDTMRRFLPEDTLDRTLRRDGFLDYLGGEVKRLLESAQDALRAEGDAAPSYRM